MVDFKILTPETIDIFDLSGTMTIHQMLIMKNLKMI